MRDKGIVDIGLQQDIIRLLIDALYDVLVRVAGDGTLTHVHVVDVRGTLGPGEWADEIHGTSAGFIKIADRFRTAILAVL